MNYFQYKIIVFAFSINIVYALNATKFETPNLKTVLFKEVDLIKPCWVQSDINLLIARRFMQELIPKKIPRNFPLLLTYLKNSTFIVNQTVADGKFKQILLTALDDVIGGYLQAIVIPIANEAFYAGNVEYEIVAELHDMLDNIKIRLYTDGGSWSRQCEMYKISTKVSSLHLNLHSPQSACAALYVTPTSGPNGSASFSQSNINTEVIISEMSRVAIPYLDNNIEPNAVAIPLRVQNLFSLSNPSAKYILVRYYSIVMRCLSNETTEDVLAFNHLFHQWIVTKVVPHLHDNSRWYPGFGGVMRIIETMNRRGLASSTNPIYIVPPLVQADAPKECIMEVKIEEEEQLCKLPFLTRFNFTSFSNFIFLFLLIALALFISFLLCFCLCCLMKFCRSEKKYTPLHNIESKSVANAVLSIYCGLKDSLMKKKSSDTSYESTEPESEDLKHSEQPSKYVLNKEDTKWKSPINATPMSNITDSNSSESAGESGDEFSTSSSDRT